MRNKRKNNQTPLYGTAGLLTRPEVAERLHVSYTTVDVWTRQGKIPAVHHPLGAGRGRPVFYHWPDVEASLVTIRKPVDRRYR